jgi:hypothetical protein
MVTEQFRKGELEFYKGFYPKEFKKYIKDLPEEEEHVTKFLDNFRYDYVQKE